MRAADKFSIFWWGLYTVVVTVYASLDGWSEWHIVGASIYGALFIFEILRHRGKLKERLVDRRVVSDKHLAPMFGRAISDWDRVFTVKPVHTLDAGWVFCRYVWRRRIAKHSYLDGGGDFWFQYLVKLQYVYD